MSHNLSGHSLWWVFTLTLLFGPYKHCWNKYHTLYHSLHIGDFFFFYKTRSQVWECWWDRIHYICNCYIVFPYNHNTLYLQNQHRKGPLSPHLCQQCVIWECLNYNFSQEASHSRRQPKYYPSSTVDFTYPLTPL